MTSHSHRYALVAVAVGLVALILTSQPSPAYADGDPASDFLVTQRVFVPFNAPRPQLKQELIALAFEAKRAGFPIRVAVIQARADLGAIPQLYGKPETYARFLGAELRWIYKNRLLVAMRQGYGYTRAGQPIKGSANTLASLRPPSGNSPNQLTQAAITAVRRLATAAGHPLPVPHARPVAARPSGSFLSQNRTIIAGALVAVEGACLTALMILLARRRGWLGRWR